MNNLLEEREKLVKQIQSLDDQINDNDSKTRKVNNHLSYLEKEREVLVNEKYKLLNTSNLQILFLIKIDFSGPEHHPASEYWDLYYYNYINDTLVVKRQFGDCCLYYPNAININSYFEKDTIDYIKEFLINYVLKLIEEQNITSWDNLHEAIEKSIKENDFANFLELYRLEEKRRKLEHK